LIKVASLAPGTIEIFITNNQKEMFKIGLVFELRSNGQSKNYFLKGLLVDEAGPEDLAPPLPAMSLSQALQQIEEEIKRTAAEDKFSGVVLVAQNFQPIFFKAYGYASKEFSVPNQLNTRFNLGSINKIFTKIAIGQLAHKGKLSLDDRLGKFMPGYPNADAREKVTVRHLVNMTSGIGDFFGPEFRDTPKDFIRHNRDYLRFFASKPLAFEPGSREMYSNGGYVVLGEIISAASGMDYYEYVRKNIFEPAGMKDSDWFEADAVVANVAEGYTKQQEEIEKIESPPQDKTPAEQKLLSRPGKVMNSKAADKEESSSPGEVGTKNQEAEKVSHTSSPKNRVLRAEAIDPVGSVNPVLSQPQEQPANPTWRRNIYTRPARGSAAGGGYATAEDLLWFLRALDECRLLSEPWTNWVFTGQEPEKTNSPKVGENRKQWSLAIAGGAPGINAVLEFDAGTGYTIIVLSNYDPPAAGQIARMVGRYLKAVQPPEEN
jgi:CubicO group peptidase (beta-lactamase class C family)